MDAGFSERPTVHSDRIPSIVSGLGLLLLFSSLAEWVAFNGLEGFTSDDFLASVLVSASLTVAIVYGGYRLGRSDLPSERYRRIVTWMAGCAFVFFAINIPIMVVWIPSDPAAKIWWTRFVVSVGLTSGLLIGGIEAHAIQRERAAERAAVRAEEAELHHRDLDYLNSLLRHEVLNTANVITGYASLVIEDDEVGADARERAETIHRQGRDMTDVIRDVQVLIAATRGAAELESKDVGAILAAELDDIRWTAEAVEVEAAVPDDLHVMADDLLPRVFSNLLTNAVEHNDSETPRVTVTVEESADAATVRIADDGPGIPPEERSRLFERGDNTGASHGLGLYLVRTLVERYDGTVELAETGDDGTEFAVTLPTATPATGDSASVGSQTDRESRHVSRT